MITGSIQYNIPIPDPQRAIDAFNALMPQILTSPSVRSIMEIMATRPPLANTRGGRKRKPLTLPDHWHVELLNGDVHFYNDLPYAKYVYAPRRRLSNGWPIAQKVEEDMTPSVQRDIDVLWRQANASALFVR